MKIRYTYSVIPAIALALAVSNPASAQLLGGSGSLGGGLTGTMQRGTGEMTGSTSGSIQGQKQIDRKSGRVQGSGTAQGSSTGSVSRNNRTSNGSASATKSGSIDAQAIGTDDARNASQYGAARGSATATKSRNSSNEGARRSSTGSSGTMSSNGILMVRGTGMAQGGESQFAASGSVAASRSGMFVVEPGMRVYDAKNRTIAYVQSYEQTARGAVQSITVEIGNRFATFPAKYFSGSGEVLVTGMTKSEMTAAAKEQEASGASEPATAQQPAATQEPSATQEPREEAQTSSPQNSTAQPRRNAAGNKERNNNTKDH